MFWSLFACAVSSPFEGNGLDEDGAISTDYEAPFFVSVTHAIPEKGMGDVFDDHVAAIEEQLANTDGAVAWSLRGEVGGRDRWTITIWEDEEAMLLFMTSGAHLDAMLDAEDVLAEFDTNYWIEDDRTAPQPGARPSTCSPRSRSRSQIPLLAPCVPEVRRDRVRPCDSPAFRSRTGRTSRMPTLSLETEYSSLGRMHRASPICWMRFDS